MADNDVPPENIVRIIDLISSIILRIKEKRLDKASVPCLYMAQRKGAAT